jgi:hypothetical protein
MRKLWRNAPVHRRAADDRAGVQQLPCIVGGTYAASDEKRRCQRKCSQALAGRRRTRRCAVLQLPPRVLRQKTSNAVESVAVRARKQAKAKGGKRNN